MWRIQAAEWEKGVEKNREQLLAACSEAELQMSDGAGGGVRERRKWSSTAGVGNPWDSFLRGELKQM